MNTEASFDRYGVLKVAMSEPEQFILAFLNSQPENPFMRTSSPMTESEIRMKLAEMELSPAKIEELIKKARENPQ